MEIAYKISNLFVRQSGACFCVTLLDNNHYLETSLTRPSVENLMKAIAMFLCREYDDYIKYAQKEKAKLEKEIAKDVEYLKNADDKIGKYKTYIEERVKINEKQLEENSRKIEIYTELINKLADITLLMEEKEVKKDE